MLFALLFAQVAEGPKVAYIGLAAPNVVHLVVEAGRRVPAVGEPYSPHPGDQPVTSGVQTWLVREGKEIGARVGHGGNTLFGFDSFVGAKFDGDAAQRSWQWTLSAGGKRLRPTLVHRKSKPTDFARTAAWKFEAPMRHELFFVFDKPVPQGKLCRLDSGGNLSPVSFTPKSDLRSEAIHVSHIGFRPDDPSKFALLGCWTGDGGGIKYAPSLPFQVVDAAGRSVIRGKATLSKSADDAVEDAYKRNYSGSDVWLLDFSSLRTPGKYRVVVPGIGSSAPFEVSRDAWLKPFRASARGLYVQRSGIALGPPTTPFKRPLSMRHLQGKDAPVFHSETSILDSGNGINALGTDKDNFGNLVKGKTDQKVLNTWGGYHDAADYDSRIQHLEATRLLLELLEIRPASAKIDLGIAESKNKLPDLLDEALFNLDHYRRLQTEEGGVRGGVEMEEHPRYGETSWRNTLQLYAYAPDPWASWLYAASAARAVRQLRPLDPAQADTYQRSATRAMEWAEANRANFERPLKSNELRDARNLAAIELYRTTGNARWRKVFEQTSVFREGPKTPIVWQSHDQREASYAAAVCARPLDPAIKANSRTSLLAFADEIAASTRNTGYRWAKESPFAWVGVGAVTTPRASVNLVRAHSLTKDAKYLKGMVEACQSGAGANPLNLCYTTGVGWRWPTNAMHLDSRWTKQPVPEGITVYGPFDPQQNSTDWQMKLVDQFCYPKVETWPANEAYFDGFWLPILCEFTIMESIGPNAYVWGYLATR